LGTTGVTRAFSIGPAFRSSCGSIRVASSIVTGHPGNILPLVISSA
jgi:hypothetical protein